jgi:protein-disulfide isomerase
MCRSHRLYCVACLGLYVLVVAVVVGWTTSSLDATHLAAPNPHRSAHQRQRVASQASKAPTSQFLTGASLLGNLQARVALIHYSDFHCPASADFISETWPSLRQHYVDSGKVLVAFRHLPLERHVNSLRTAASATCAANQGRFWEMHDQLFRRRGSLSADTGRLIAGDLHLDLRAFDSCVQQASAVDLTRDDGFAKALNIRGTPTFVLGLVTSDGRVEVSSVLVGAQPLQLFERLLDSLVASSEADRE